MPTTCARGRRASRKVDDLFRRRVTPSCRGTGQRCTAATMPSRVCCRGGRTGSVREPAHGGTALGMAKYLHRAAGRPEGSPAIVERLEAALRASRANAPGKKRASTPRLPRQARRGPQRGPPGRLVLTSAGVRVSLRVLRSGSEEVDHAVDCTTRFLRPLRSQPLASPPSRAGSRHAAAGPRSVSTVLRPRCSLDVVCHATRR